MDFQPIIDDLQGRAAALNSTIETLKMLQAGDSALNTNIPSEEQPISPPSAVKEKRTGKDKAMRLARKAKPPKSGNKRAAILEYLRQHPGSGAVEIAKALGFSRAATTWNLGEARDSGMVKIEGRSSNAKWSLVKQDANAKTPAAIAPDPEIKLECRFCHAPCASLERLQSHMRVVHGKNSI